MLQEKYELNSTINSQATRSRRYTEKEKDFFTFKYVQGGKAAYEFDHENSFSPSIRTCQRHLNRLNRGIEPDCLRLQDFLKFLETNNLPKVFVLSEDATRITGGIGYDTRRDQVYGLVSPIGPDGMPMKSFFPASSPMKVIEYIQKYPIGRNLYVTMAQPLKHGAASFCIMFSCSDNKFLSDDVLRRWNHTEQQCSNAGLNLICRASDGDPRLISAMLRKMSLPCGDQNPFGPWYVAKFSVENICIQDPIHLINKMRTRLMKTGKRLILGKAITPVLITSH